MGTNTTDKIGYVLSDNFSLKNCRQNPTILFVFGDNEGRSGMGGQAIIRQEPNAIGIATKKSVSEYWDDKNFLENKEVIIDDILRVANYFNEGGYKALCFPKNGFGTGLAQLHLRAPYTFCYLTTSLLDTFDYNNYRGLKTS